MTAIVFVGPSLAGASPAPPPGVTLAGPAAAGDLYRAARAGAGRSGSPTASSRTARRSGTRRSSGPWNAGCE